MTIFSDLMAARWPFRQRRRSWGPWSLVGDALVLDRGAGRTYAVDLARATDAASRLDWINHVARKQWATDEIVANLVRALIHTRGAR